MAQLSKHHKTTTDGVGKCAVPMWMGGCQAGFCDEPAFGSLAASGHLDIAVD